MNLHICRSYRVNSFDDSSSDSSFGSKRRISSISLQVLFALRWCAMTTFLQVFFPLATAPLLSLGHLLHCIGRSVLLCCTWLGTSRSFHQVCHAELLASWTLPTRGHVATIMFFLHGSDFAARARLCATTGYAPGCLLFHRARCELISACNQHFLESFSANWHSAIVWPMSRSTSFSFVSFANAVIVS